MTPEDLTLISLKTRPSRPIRCDVWIRVRQSAGAREQCSKAASSLVGRRGKKSGGKRRDEKKEGKRERKRGKKGGKEGKD